MDADGNSLVPGQIIDDEFSGLGITVTTSDPINHPLMIFQTAAPTGGDTDLGTPNVDFGGPGVGDGGAADMAGRNGLPRGQILIVSEDANSGDPNDYDGPSVIDFVFDPPMPLVTEVHILDIDNPANGGFVTAFDADGFEIQSQPILPLGNNSFRVVPIGASTSVGWRFPLVPAPGYQGSFSAPSAAPTSRATSVPSRPPRSIPFCCCSHRMYRSGYPGE